MSREEKGILWAGAGVAGLLALILVLPRVPQDPAYHHFAADYEIFGIPNFWNVVSNIPFLVVAFIASKAKGAVSPLAKRSATEWVFLAGLVLTGLGSAYYHWQPTTQRLFWDRLPMTIAFSAVTAALVGQRIHPKWGQKALWPLVVAGLLTVVYWRWSETRGKGNLVPYGIVQFGTVALVLAVLLMFPKKGPKQNLLWVALAMYVVAKLLEGFDQSLGRILQVIGGHPFKHAAAAAGCWFLWRGIFAETSDSRSPASVA
jgi:hypothetical protein